MTHTVDRPSSAPASHRIGKPDGAREPLKVNVYERMQHANTQLVPLFPYYGREAMVLSGALFRGGQDVDYGHFFHNNTVHEINFVWGAENALVDTGRIMATSYLHGVNSFLRDQEAPDAFLLVTVLQRQTDGEPQPEQIIWRCGECHERLLVHDYAGDPPDEDDERFPVFPTIVEAVDAVNRYNADESLRTCSKCGHVNPPFPDERWGWARWALHQRTITDARNALLAAAADSAN